MSNRKNGTGIRPLIIIATLCAATSLILYWTGGTNKLSPDLNRMCLIGFSCAAGIGLVFLILSAMKKMSVLLAYAQYLAALWGFAEYIVSQLNYIANVFYGVDGNQFTPVMIATACAGLAAFVLALTAAIRLRKLIYRQDLAAAQEV